MKIDCSYTKNYLAEKKRMLEQNENNCSTSCAECPFSCDENGKDLFCTQFEMLYPKEAIAKVQMWSINNPRKTKKEAFLEAFPNALTDEEYPLVCPIKVYGIPGGVVSCEECIGCKGCASVWDEPVEVE